MGRRSAAELFFNRVVTHVPHNGARLRYLRWLGMHADPHTYLFGGSEVIAPHLISIAGNCHIGRLCQIDGRGGITIGRNVVIASHAILVTADHDPNDPAFPGRLGPITIADRAWVGTRATVFKNVSIGEGAVVAGGSVVVRDVAPWTIVAGNPAKAVGTRSPVQTYEIDYGPTFY